MCCLWHDATTAMGGWERAAWLHRRCTSTRRGPEVPAQGGRVEGGGELSSPGTRKLPPRLPVTPRAAFFGPRLSAASFSLCYPPPHPRERVTRNAIPPSTGAAEGGEQASPQAAGGRVRNCLARLCGRGMTCPGPQVHTPVRVPWLACLCAARHLMRPVLGSGPAEVPKQMQNPSRTHLPRVWLRGALETAVERPRGSEGRSPRPPTSRVVLGRPLSPCGGLATPPSFPPHRRACIAAGSGRGGARPFLPAPIRTCTTLG